LSYSEAQDQTQSSGKSCRENDVCCSAWISCPGEGRSGALVVATRTIFCPFLFRGCCLHPAAIQNRLFRTRNLRGATATWQLGSCWGLGGSGRAEPTKTI